MNKEKEEILSYYLQSWDLIPDEKPFYTHASLIQHVLYGGIKATLKIPFSDEEKTGGRLMSLWDGLGAAKVFCYDDTAILMERITGRLSLKAMATGGQDTAATEILCDVVELLHLDRKETFPGLIPLNVWFRDLFSSAERYGGVFRKPAGIASSLIGNQRNMTILHGDIHHDNVLYSSERGWLAIDPKGLLGENTFDYVNILCNPDKETALADGRLMKQIDIISKKTGIEPSHLLKWTVAWAGLSAVWFLNDNLDGSLSMGVMEMGLVMLG